MFEEVNEIIDYIVNKFRFLIESLSCFFKDEIDNIEIDVIESDVHSRYPSLIEQNDSVKEHRIHQMVEAKKIRNAQN